MEPISLFSANETGPNSTIPHHVDYVKSRIPRNSVDLTLVLFYRIKPDLNDLARATEISGIYEKAFSDDEEVLHGRDPSATTNIPITNFTAFNNIYEVIADVILPVITNNGAEYNAFRSKIADLLKPAIYYDEQQALQRTPLEDNPYVIRSTEQILNDYYPELIAQYNARDTNDYIWDLYGKIAAKYTIRLNDFNVQPNISGNEDAAGTFKLNDSKYVYTHCIYNNGTHPDVFKTWLTYKFRNCACLRLNTSYTYNDKLNFIIKLDDHSANLNPVTFRDIPGKVI